MTELSCLALDSPRWVELEHAYGRASDIPELLRQLAAVPTSGGSKEPWFSIWSALAHQNDVYPATFAAVPHVVRVIAAAPDKVDFGYFQFPAVVEAWRQKNQTAIPDDLRADYFAALAALPSLVAATAAHELGQDFLASALAAVAAAKGFGSIAETVLELTPNVVRKFESWLMSGAR
ncbi:hypothetical protein AB4Y45_33000 [Paraburkholderia sp. EG287A]|uniref:hypothetical protein n=1 Tax=Paraburkholderia sp. EG287A TaxID=3237012 RepID=UPI0034D2CDEA